MGRGRRSLRRRARCMRSGASVVAGPTGMATSQAPACGPACERSIARVLGSTAGSRTRSRKESGKSVKCESCMLLPAVSPNAGLRRCRGCCRLEAVFPGRARRPAGRPQVRRRLCSCPYAGRLRRGPGLQLSQAPLHRRPAPLLQDGQRVRPRCPVGSWRQAPRRRQAEATERSWQERYVPRDLPRIGPYFPCCRSRHGQKAPQITVRLQTFVFFTNCSLTWCYQGLKTGWTPHSLKNSMVLENTAVLRSIS